MQMNWIFSADEVYINNIACPTVCYPEIADHNLAATTIIFVGWARN
jgi:hypothetical protein